jgi:translation initiation factor IF-3
MSGDDQNTPSNPYMRDRNQRGPAKTRVNESIRANQVRVVAEDGSSLGIMSASDALKAARDAGLDLVEIAPQANPPVCRLLSYSKWRYQQERQERAKRQHTQDVKVIKFGIRIGEGDLDTKCRKITELLADGAKVRVVIAMRGREVTHPELADELLVRVDGRIGSAGRREGSARREGRNITVDYLPNAR